MRYFRMSVFNLFMLLFLACNAGYADDNTLDPQKKIDNPVKNESKGIPSIKFDALKHDFGKTTQNQTLNHVFIFKNMGAGVLTIQKVKGG